MNYAVIACRVFNRELSAAVARSENRCIVYWLPQGLHETPELLRNNIKATIKKIEEENETLRDHLKYDAIVICYGLCSNGIIGISSEKFPIIIPRCDDCIALFLGSQERYLKLFSENGGTYWFNAGWIEEGFVPSENNYEQRRAEYAEAYGEENADFLMEESSKWLLNYSRLIYIESEYYDNTVFEDYTQKAAEYLKYDFKKVMGSGAFLDALLSSSHDDRFLVLEPYEICAESFDDKKIKKDKKC